MKAIWHGKIIAESDQTEIVEGNHYFPREAIKTEYFQESRAHTNCWWKGRASYYNIVVDGDVNKNAAWYYPQPSEKAKNIKDRIAFWRGVQVTE